MKHTLMIITLACALLIGLGQPTVALACSGMLPTVEQSAIAAQVAVIGTFKDSSENVVTLEVELYLKNPQLVSYLAINNHAIVGTGNGDCSTTLGPGHRYQNGERVLVFLQRDEYDVGAEWRVMGLFAPEAYPIIDAMVTVPAADGGYEQITLEQAKERIADEVGAPTQPQSPPIVDQPVELPTAPPPVDVPIEPAPPPYPGPGQTATPIGFVPTPWPTPTATPGPAGAGSTADPVSPASVGGIPIVPLVLLLIAVLGFGLSAWGISRQREQTRWH